MLQVKFRAFRQQHFCAVSCSVLAKVGLLHLIVGVTSDGLVVLSGTLLPLPALHTLTLAAKPGVHLEMQHCTSIPLPLV